MYKIVNAFRQWWAQPKALRSYRDVVIVASMADVPELPASKIYLVHRGGVNRRLVFACPCGTAHRVDVNLMPSTQPCWRLTEKGRKVSLWPSIAVDRDGSACGAHFWLQDNKAMPAEWDRR